MSLHLQNVETKKNFGLIFDNLVSTYNNHYSLNKFYYCHFWINLNQESLYLSGASEGGRGYKSRLHGGPQRWFPNQNASWVTTVLVDIVRTYVTSWRHSTTSHRQIDRRTDGRDLRATCDDRLAAPYRGSFPQTPGRGPCATAIARSARFYTSDAASNATFTYCTAYVWLVCQCIHTSRA